MIDLKTGEFNLRNALANAFTVGFFKGYACTSTEFNAKAKPTPGNTDLWDALTLERTYVMESLFPSGGKGEILWVHIDEPVPADIEMTL